MGEGQDVGRRGVLLSIAGGFADFGGSLIVGDALGREPEPRPGAAPAAVGRIVELDASAVLLEDAADDGEPEAGALLARRHIGLEQSLAVLLVQSAAVVDDGHYDVG